jgi:hypothetical protein
VPDLVITHGWMYVVGDAPCVGTTAVTASAEGCTLLLYYFGPSGDRHCRVCFLEGAPGALVWVYRAGHAAARGCLSPGTYCEAITSDSGQFERWRDTPANFAQLVEVLEDNDQDHQLILDAVEAFRHDYGVG